MALHDYVYQLRQVELFQALSMEAVRLIAFSAEARILRVGDVLFHEGEAAGEGYVVLSGVLALTHSGAPDSDVQLAGPGSLVGEMALLAATERPATAIAREATGVLRIPRTLFHRVLQEFPECAVRMRAELAARTLRMSVTLDAFGNRFVSG